MTTPLLGTICHR